LDDVAKMLGTKAVIPKYHEVANALGAIVGNISATYTVEIRPNYSNRGISGFMVFGGNDTKVFKKLEEAEAFAMDEAKSGAQAEAVRRGASGEIAISCTVYKDEGEGRDQMIYLGTQVTALAVGTIGF
jgi:hypothetical protein